MLFFCLRWPNPLYSFNYRGEASSISIVRELSIFCGSPSTVVSAEACHLCFPLFFSFFFFFGPNPAAFGYSKRKIKIKKRKKSSGNASFFFFFSFPACFENTLFISGTSITGSCSSNKFPWPPTNHQPPLPSPPPAGTTFRSLIQFL